MQPMQNLPACKPNWSAGARFPSVPTATTPPSEPDRTEPIRFDPGSGLSQVLESKRGARQHVLRCKRGPGCTVISRYALSGSGDESNAVRVRAGQHVFFGASFGLPI